MGTTRYVDVRPDDKLETMLRLSFPYSPDENGLWTLKVQIEAEGLRCDRDVLTLRGDALDQFFSDLAADWRGWEGTRRWEALENGMSIEATHQGSRVELVFTLRRDYNPDTWEVRLPIRVTPGESLARLVRETQLLLAARP